MNEFEILFYEKLGLQYLAPAMREHFFSVMKAYLSHGRTYEYVANNLDKLLFFFECIGIGNLETAIILINFPSILNITDELYDKYIFLGIIENEDNSFRRHKFFSKTKDYRVGIHKMYARYKLCLETGYDNVKWNTLVHASDNEFAKIFISSAYRKPYQKFDSVERVNEWLGSVYVTKIDIDQFKKLPVNKELVEKYEKKYGKRTY